MPIRVKKLIFKTIRTDCARENMLTFILKNKREGKTLDIGGRNSPYASLFNDRVGLDIKQGKGVDIVASVYEIPFPDNTFDNILCTELLEHLNEPQAAVNELYRVMKPGGKIILTTRFIYPIHGEPDDFFRYTEYGLKYLFRNFKNISIEPETKGWETFSVLVQGIAWETDQLRNKFRFYFLLLISRLLKFFLSKDSERISSGYYLTAEK